MYELDGVSILKQSSDKVVSIVEDADYDSCILTSGTFWRFTSTEVELLGHHPRQQQSYIEPRTTRVIVIDLSNITAYDYSGSGKHITWTFDVSLVHIVV